MAFVPSGTRNVIAKSYSLPKGIDANLRRIRAVNTAKRWRTIDVGVARTKRKGRLFLNAAEIGLGAHIIDRSRKIREVVNSRTLSTLATVLTTIPTYQSNQCEVSLNDGDWRMFPHITICMVSNGAYLGGGFKMAPRADTSDGLLDLTIVKDSGSFKLLTQLFNMKTGKFANDAKVQYEQSKKIAIRSAERDVAITVDGEPTGFLPSVFEIVPKALKFV
jgi:diacylglycerol kinase (ATP)